MAERTLEVLDPMPHPLVCSFITSCYCLQHRVLVQQRTGEIQPKKEVGQWFTHRDHQEQGGWRGVFFPRQSGVRLKSQERIWVGGTLKGEVRG